MKKNQARHRKERVRVVDTLYVCTLKRNSEGGYSVRCPAFPEIVTWGRTLEEARAMAKDAIELCLDVYLDEGWRIPKPDSVPAKAIREFIPVRPAYV